MNTPETPLTQPHEVLLRLHEDYRVGAYVSTLPHEPPRVEREFAGGAYDMELVGRWTWYITPEVVRHLEDHGWLDSGDPQGGWTNRFKRRLSRRGEEALWDFVRQANAMIDGLTSMYKPPPDPSTYWAV